MIRIIVSNKGFNSDDPYDLVYSNVTVINVMRENDVPEDKIAKESMISYLVDFYLGQMNNGGFGQFVYNSRFDDSVVELIAEGLDKMGLVKHAELFARGREAVAAESAEDLAAYFESEYFGDNEFRDRLDAAVTDAFFALKGEEDIIAANAKWLRSLPNIAPMSIEEMQAEIDARAE